MKNDNRKNFSFLALTGLVIATVNTSIWIATTNGQLAPIGNLPLWSAGAVLTLCSILWAIVLLGVDPLIVALSCVAGAHFAYLGVRVFPEVGIAEITSAGATYGAFGSLIAGHLTTKVRLSTFRKGQVPVVFIILSLLVINAAVGSHIFELGWSVIGVALVLPLLVAGVVISAVWTILMQWSSSRGGGHQKPSEASDVPDEPEMNKVPADESTKLIIDIPEHVEVDNDVPEGSVAMEAVENVSMESVAVDDSDEPHMLLDEEPVDNDHFFPLEIDKGSESEFVTIAEEKIPDEFTGGDMEEKSVEVQIPEIDTKDEVVRTDAEKASNNWLGDHLDILEKIKKNVA